ncbi:hypothetical protein K0U27_00195 [archaeon]|nr:hypothetical protein [archaeon]
MIFSIFTVSSFHESFGTDPASHTKESPDISPEDRSANEPIRFEIDLKSKDVTDVKNEEFKISFEEIKNKSLPSIETQTEKIIITRNYYMDNEKISFFIRSSDDKIPIPSAVKVIPDEFFITEKTPVSIAADRIEIPNMDAVASFVEEKNAYLIEFADNSTVNSLGKYTGKITLNAEGFNPKQVDVEYNTQWHPGLLIVFSAVGIGFSMILGIVLMYNERETVRKNIVTANKAIIEHINIHVENMNILENANLKNHMIKAYHKSQVRWADENSKDKESNKHYISKLSTEHLKTILEHYELHQKYMLSYPSGKNTPLDPFNTEFADETKSKTSLNSIKVGQKMTITSITAFFVLLIAIPITLVSITYFSGNPFIDAILAGIIGFTIYRTKEIGKIIKNVV